MAELENSDFTTPGATLGAAQGWTFTTSVAAWDVFDIANLDGEFVGYEDFTDTLGTEDALTGVTFGIDDSAENFEKLWGPFDGTDPAFPTVVPIGYAENASFLFELGQTAAMIFHPNATTFEDFDEFAPLLLLWADVTSATATFAGGAQVESFESGWANTDYLLEFGPVDLAAAQFGFTAPAIFESFEAQLAFDEVGQILAAELGAYGLTLNVDSFEFTFLVGNEATIVTGLISAVNNSSAKFTAGTIPALGVDVIGLRIDDPNTELKVKITGPANDDVALISSELRQDYWLLPDKTI